MMHTTRGSTGRAGQLEKGHMMGKELSLENSQETIAEKYLKKYE